jgi:outer membrane protein OmpA-like peptidoglycan-associated protein
MKLSHTIAPALAAILVTACATHASAPERAEQAQEDKQRADDQARQARIDAENARASAADAARAQHEADVKAQYAAQEAAQAERDAHQPAPGPAGVAEPQGDGRVVAVPAPDSGVSFAAKSADLSGDDRARLDDLAGSLRAHPAQQIVIKGYADDTGSDSTDAQLSQQRADAVAHYLEKKGVSGDRIVTKVGTWSSASTDDVTRRRALHHRVEIIVK